MALEILFSFFPGAIFKSDYFKLGFGNNGRISADFDFNDLTENLLKTQISSNPAHIPLRLTRYYRRCNVRKLDRKRMQAPDQQLSVLVHVLSLVGVICLRHFLLQHDHHLADAPRSDQVQAQTQRLASDLDIG